MVIVLDGCDGCGKSTIAKLLKERLEKQGKKVCLTHEPYGNGISNSIKQLIENSDDLSLETEALLYAAARAQHIKEVIRPAIERGEIVICDRFISSSLVYQGIVGGLGTDKIKKINAFAYSEDLYIKEFFIDVKPDVCLERMKNRKNLSKIDKKPIEYHKKIYEGFKTIYKMTPSIERINGESSLDSIVDMILSSLRNTI